MAQPMQCDTQCGTPAAMLVTMISSGDVQAYCAPCYLDIVVALLAETGRMAEIVQAAVDAQAAEASAATGTPKRARKGAGAAAPAPVQDTPAGDESTPAQQAPATA